MKLGAISFMTDYSIAPDEFAMALEANGFDSFWAGDHTHIPVDPNDGGPTMDPRFGTALQPEYWHLVDPFIALTYAAAATSTIKLGVGVCMINERDPIILAKQSASIDHLSNGRFILGIGAGWNEQEMLNHGTNPKTRIKLMRERVEAMRTIWANDIAEYHGELVEFSPMMSWPKPVQPGGVPISIGGNKKNVPRVVAYGDGWCPSMIALSEEEIVEQVTEFRRLCEEAGRPRLDITAFHVAPVADLDVGSPLEVTQERWDVYQRAGVDRLVIMLPPWRDPNLRLVERYSRFVAGERSAV
jgi:probable F420-dependent oxidoreductase